MKALKTTALALCLASIGTFAQHPSIGGYNVYYGSLHNHCNHSDGTGTADQAYNYAKNTAHLDFFSLADHAESVSATEWTTTMNAANANNQDGVFTAFWGFEWSHSTYGHVAVINTNDYCASNQTATNNFTSLLTWLSTRECVAFFNHPGRQNSTGVEFNHFTNTPSDKIVGMELWNKADVFDDYYYNDGYYASDGNLSYYDESHVRGWRIGASGAEDNHTGDWGTRTPNRLAILSNSLTRTDLYNAMKLRRFFTTTDKNIALSFKVDGQEMGSVMPGAFYSIAILASDADNEVFTRVDLLKNGQVVQSWFPNSTAVNITHSISTAHGDYLYVRVKQSDGGEAISSPVSISGNTNNPPTCSITSPANNAQYPAPQQITITASAGDSDGSVAQVEFFVDGVSVGVDNLSPYSVNWTIPTNDRFYVLTARATDNLMSTGDAAAVTISAGTPPITVSSRIASGNDDVEESSAGSMYMNSTDIELVYDGSYGNQVVGLRFTGLNIPQGSSIVGAALQFTTDEAFSTACNLTIKGHAADNSAAFTTATYNVSGRPTTAASVAWAPQPWTVLGAAGPEQKSPDLSTILQEIVNRPGYSSGSAISIIITGTGTRTAEAYEGSNSQAPLLTVSYLPANSLPQVSITAPSNGATYTQGATVTFTANASDSDGSIAQVEFLANAAVIGTDNTQPYSFSWIPGTGTFELRARATDNKGGVSVSAPVTITVSSPVTEVVLSYDDFESGWGNWTSGGIDCSIATSTTFAHQGSKSANIQDNSGLASSFYHTNGYDVTSFSTIKVEFWFKANGMENKEDFWLEYFNGNTWSVVQSWKRNTHFNNGSFYNVTVNISKLNYVFPVNMKLRFKCDASADDDDVYIDEVKVTGIYNTANQRASAVISSSQLREESGDPIGSLIVFPNPVGQGSEFSVRLSDVPGESDLTLYDAGGRAVRQLKIVDVTDLTLDTGGLGKGIYFLVLRNRDGLYTEKLVIR